ncbi:MAG TPA: TonB family protein [Terriglobia bacterium]|jgi:TonB family protein|nr:TonB family protein [Terriglobia bacterium]
MSFERHEECATDMVSLHGMRCPRCSTSIRPGKKFCSHCGSPAGMLLTSVPGIGKRSGNARFTICLECGFENHYSDRFCKGCGDLMIASPAQVAGHDPSGHGSTAVKVIAPVDSKSGCDPGSGVLDPGFQAAAVRAAVAGLDVVIKPAGGPGLEIEPSLEIKSGTFGPAGSLGVNEVPLRREAVAGPVVSEDETGPTPVASGETANPQTGPPVAKPRVFRARGAGIAVVSAMMLGGLTLLSTRHDASKGAGRTSSPAATVPALPLQVAANRVSPAPRVWDERTLPTEASPALSARSSAAISRGKLDSAKAQPSSEDAAKARVPAGPAVLGITTPTPQNTVASLDLTSKGPNSVLDTADPPALNSSSEPVPVPQPVRGAEGTASVTVASLPLPASASAEVELGLPSPSSPGVRTLDVGGVVQPAKLLADPFPVYPGEARIRRVQGTVHLLATVRKDGNLANLKVTSGDRMLVGAAVAAARLWSYQPALLDGQPIQSQADIAITFRLPK